MAEDSMFESRIREILYQYPYNNGMDGPTMLLDYMYIGNYTDAYNTVRLKELGITHVLNCAAFSKSEANPYEASVGITGYKQFHADDDDNYDMMQHFPAAKEFIDDARAKSGKVLIHCAMGINRSGVICISYMMLDKHIDLLEAIRRVKQKRGVIVCNRGFQRQLIKFARKNDLLHPPPEA